MDDGCSKRAVKSNLGTPLRGEGGDLSFADGWKV
jgi:hypothetical protein